MSLSARAARWAARKVTGTVAARAAERVRRERCKAEPRRSGHTCNRPLRTGRLADGLTCGKELCQLWYMAKDEHATAAYLGLSVEELAAQVQAARAA